MMTPAQQRSLRQAARNRLRNPDLFGTLEWDYHVHRFNFLNQGGPVERNEHRRFEFARRARKAAP